MVCRRLLQRMRICRNQPNVATTSTSSPASPATARRTTKSPAAPTRARAHVRSHISTPFARKWSAASDSTVSSSSTPASTVAQGSPLAYLAALVVMVTTMVAVFADACDEYERHCDKFDKFITKLDDRKRTWKTSQVYASLLRARATRDQAAQDVERLRLEYAEWAEVTCLTDEDLQAQRHEQEVVKHLSKYHLVRARAEANELKNKMDILTRQHQEAVIDDEEAASKYEILKRFAESSAVEDMVAFERAYRAREASKAKLEEAHEELLSMFEARPLRKVVEARTDLNARYHKLAMAAIRYTVVSAKVVKLEGSPFDEDIKKYWRAVVVEQDALAVLKTADVMYVQKLAEVHGQHAIKINLGYAGYDAEL